MSIPKYIISFTILVFCLITSSCSKDNALDELDAPGSFAGVSAFNAIGGSDSLELMIAGQVVNRDGEIFSEGTNLAYRTVFPGEQAIELKSFSPNAIYAKGKHHFLGSKFYSIFFWGKGSQDYYVSEDDILQPKDGFAKIRFVNLVQGLKVKLDYKNQSSVQSHSFTTPISNFVEVKQGANMELSVSSADRKLGAVEEKVWLQNQAIYTFVIYSVLNKETKQPELKLQQIKLP